MTFPVTTQPAHEHEARAAHRHETPAGPRPAPWALPAREPGSPTASAVDPRLLAILRCPLTGGTLIAVDADRLMSDRPFRDGVHPVYPITHGIPCLRPVR